MRRPLGASPATRRSSPTSARQRNPCDQAAVGARQCAARSRPPLCRGGRDRRARTAMYFKQILNELYGCASYLIASRQSREAAIVDPALVIDQYRDLLRERDFTLRYALDTLVHADHVSGARRLVA